MRLIYVVLIVFLSISCSRRSQETDIALEKFNHFLGSDKAMALNSAVESFDLFLKTNFLNFDNQSERVKVFLEYIQHHYEADSSWQFPTDKNQKIILDFEVSNLRKEIWTYGYEEYNPKYCIYEVLPSAQQSRSNVKSLGEIDDSLVEETIPISYIDSVKIVRQEKEMEEKLQNIHYFNINGQYLYALTKYNLNDTVIREYVDVKVIAGDISLDLLASGLLKHKINYENPFIKRILVVEFYYWIMKWDLERQGKLKKRHA